MGVYPNYGGVEKVSTILANEFIKRGFGVSIVSFEQPHPELARWELNPNVKLFSLFYPVSSISNKSQLRRIIRNEKIDILINQWCVPYYVTRLCRYAIKGTNCKLIAVHHNLPNTNAWIQGIKIDIEKGNGIKFVNFVKLSMVKIISRLSLRYTYEKSDRYVVLSPSFIPIAQAYIWKKNTPKITSIFNPITINTPDVIPSKKKELLYVGRIEDNQKRTNRLVDIWSQLEPLYPDWKFFIVGDGPDRGKLEEYIHSKRLKNISIEGFRSPLMYYKEASILILTSEYEGFPLVVTEGMSYGVVPVVLGSYQAAYDTIKNGQSGFVIPYPYVCRNFVTVLKELLENSDIRKNMSSLSMEWSRQFNRNFIIERWLDLFRLL